MKKATRTTRPRLEDYANLEEIATTYGDTFAAAVAVQATRPLLSSANVKLEKGDRDRVTIMGASFAPATMGALPGTGWTACPLAKRAACAGPCIVTAGQGGMYKADATPDGFGTRVNDSRIRRTWLLQLAPAFVIDLLAFEIGRQLEKATRAGRTLAVRLNVFSDIRWEKVAPQLFELFPGVTFYDYTKIPGRVTPANYHLTFSYSGADEAFARWARLELARGRNVAVAFSRDHGTLPASWGGLPVINGDADDYRPADPAGVIVGLLEKRTRGTRSPFIVTPDHAPALA